MPRGRLALQVSATCLLLLGRGKYRKGIFNCIGCMVTFVIVEGDVVGITQVLKNRSFLPAPD